MADLKTITLPDNSTYNLRDARVDDLAEIKTIGTGLNLSSAGVLTATGGGTGGAAYSTELPMGSDATDYPSKQLNDSASSTIDFDTTAAEAVDLLADFANENRGLLDDKANLTYNKYRNHSITYNGSSGSVLLWRWGQFVVGYFNLTCSAASANTNLTVSNVIPDGYRPAGTRYFPCIPVTNSQPSGSSRWSVNASGQIQFVSSTTGAREYRFTGIWITADDMPD